MDDNLPPRVKAAEDRARFRGMLDASGLGSPDAKAHIARARRESKALPDQWVSLTARDLVRLLDVYRNCRETWQGDHDTAVDYVLAEVDLELSKSDLTAIHDKIGPLNRH